MTSFFRFPKIIGYFKLHSISALYIRVQCSTIVKCTRFPSTKSGFVLVKLAGAVSDILNVTKVYFTSSILSNQAYNCSTTH